MEMMGFAGSTHPTSCVWNCDSTSLRAQRSNPSFFSLRHGLLRRFAPKKKQTDKLLILFNVMDEPPPSVLFHPRGSAKGRCGTRNDGRRRRFVECERPTRPAVITRERG